MSATIPSNMLMSDLLKATGYDCPQKLQGKTFDQSTEGDIPAVLEDNKVVSITENDTVEITPSEGYEGMKKVTANVNVAIPLEDNKTATIDVSAYNAPVEITPTTGNTAMKKCTVSLSNIPSGGSSDVPSVIKLETYNSDSVMLFGDKTKIARLFITNVGPENGWVDDASQISSSYLGENALLFDQGILEANLPVLCVEYDNKMYKAPASVSNNYEKYDFVEVQSQATPPTSDTPSGTVARGITIHLSTAEPGGRIYFYRSDSYNGFEEYDDSDGIEITDDMTILAVVAVDDKFTSECLELTYTVPPEENN